MFDVDTTKAKLRESSGLPSRRIKPLWRRPLLPKGGNRRHLLRYALFQALCQALADAQAATASDHGCRVLPCDRCRALADVLRATAAIETGVFRVAPLQNGHPCQRYSHKEPRTMAISLVRRPVGRVLLDAAPRGHLPFARGHGGCLQRHVPASPVIAQRRELGQLRRRDYERQSKLTCVTLIQRNCCRTDQRHGHRLAGRCLKGWSCDFSVVEQVWHGMRRKPRALAQTFNVTRWRVTNTWNNWFGRVCAYRGLDDARRKMVAISCGPGMRGTMRSAKYSPVVNDVAGYDLGEAVACHARNPTRLRAVEG